MSSPPPSITGNKKELASALGVTPPTLDRWLDRFGDAVPVIQRGSNGRPFRFDLVAVTDFFRARQADEATRTAERDEQLAQLALPGLAPDSPANATLTQREIGQALDNEGKRQRLLRDRADLVLAADISATLTAALAALGARLDALVPQIAAEHHLPPAATAALSARFASARADCVRSLQALLREPDAPAA